MMRFALLSVVALAGCLDFDLDFNATGGAYELHSDSGQLVVSACASSGLLGCAGTGQEMMTFVSDGVSRPIPPIDLGFALFAAYDHELALASPEDPIVGLVILNKLFRVEELPWFDYNAPETTDRAAGLDIAFQEYPDATVEVAVTTQCGTFQDFRPAPAPTEKGKAHITFPAGYPGTCTHDVRVTQTLLVDVPNNLDALVQVARTEHATVTTVP